MEAKPMTSTLSKIFRIAILILAVTITCTIGFSVFAEEVCQDGAHNYEATATVAPKCYKTGYTVYTCTVCGDDYKGDITETIPHIYTNECDTDCNVSACGYVREIPHVYDDACDSTCNVCYTKRTAPHSNLKATGVSEPKCYKGGYTAYVCEDCGASVKGDFTDPTPHIYSSDCDTTCNVSACGYVREDITHTYDNACDKTCNYCKEVREAPHNNLELQGVSEPKCYKGGYSAYICGDCGASVKSDFTDPTPHIYSSDCDNTCNVDACGYVREDITHTYDSVCDKTCNYCKEVREAPHNLVETGVSDPKCYKGGYTAYVCADCKTSVKANFTDPTPHIYTNNCDTTCNVCDNEREITHTYDDACDTICNVCKAERADQHDYKATATVEPKCTKGGYTVYTCTKCEETYKGDETPATGHTFKTECSNNCTVCAEYRSTTHTYDNDCDTDCNVCGGIRSITHNFGSNGKCTVCKTPATNSNTGTVITVVVIIIASIAVAVAVVFVVRKGLIKKK